MANEIKPILLTTSDNPFNPFTHPVEWRAYDEDHGYYCREYLARVAETSPDLPDEEYTKAVNEAVFNILSHTSKFPDPLLPEGVYYEMAIEE